MPTEEELGTKQEQARTDSDTAKNRKVPAISIKVSEKGGVSVYGLGRFPVTLYKEQWTRLLDVADDIRVFIRENDAKLKSKA